MMSVDMPRGQKPKELTQVRFGKLVAEKYVGGKREGLHPSWQCLCDCGNKVIVRAGNLVSGNSKSCGCLFTELLVARNTKDHDTSSPTYTSWSGMKTRCTNSKSSSWKGYGGRGISYDPAWEHYENFLADMGERPSMRHSIERIDVNGNYSKQNCVWATGSEQVNNRRNTVRWTFNGETLSVKEWADKLSINYYTLYSRVKDSGWSVEKALTTPKGSHRVR